MAHSSRYEVRLRRRRARPDRQRGRPVRGAEGRPTCGPPQSPRRRGPRPAGAAGAAALAPGTGHLCRAAKGGRGTEGQMILAEVGRIALLLALWAALASLRGPACPWGWASAAEGMAVAAWVAADGIAAYWDGGRKDLAPWELGRLLGRISVAVAVALVLAWSLAGVAVCQGRGYPGGTDHQRGEGVRQSGEDRQADPLRGGAPARRGPPGQGRNSGRNCLRGGHQGDLLDTRQAGAYITLCKLSLSQQPALGEAGYPWFGPPATV